MAKTGDDALDTICPPPDAEHDQALRTAPGYGRSAERRGPDAREVRGFDRTYESMHSLMRVAFTGSGF